MKHRHLSASALLAFFALSPLHAADAAKCPISAESLSAQLGQTLKVSHQDRAIIGNGCEYVNAARTLKIAVDGGPNPMPSAEMWRKVSSPPGATWKAIANDPDKATVMVANADGPVEPKLSYERKGWLVEIVAIPSDKSSYAAWADKLVKLKRIPE